MQIFKYIKLEFHNFGIFEEMELLTKMDQLKQFSRPVERERIDCEDVVAVQEALRNREKAAKRVKSAGSLGSKKEIKPRKSWNMVSAGRTRGLRAS